MKLKDVPRSKNVEDQRPRHTVLAPNTYTRWIEKGGFSADMNRLENLPPYKDGAGKSPRLDKSEFPKKQNMEDMLRADSLRRRSMRRENQKNK